MGFPGGSDSKESACKKKKRICLQCRSPEFDPWVGKIPWSRELLPTPVFLPGEFHGQRIPVGCPRGHKDLGTSERLTHAEIYPGEMTGCMGFAWKIFKAKKQTNKQTKNNRKEKRASEANKMKSWEPLNLRDESIWLGPLRSERENGKGLGAAGRELDRCLAGLSPGQEWGWGRVG